MIDPQVAFDKLAGFQTPYELRDYFQSEEICGIRGDDMHCPIATWMQKTTGNNEISAASNITVWEHVDSWKVSLKIPATKSMNSFMEMFDGGHFPELIAEAKDDYYE